MADPEEKAAPGGKKHIFTVSMHAWYTATAILLASIVGSWTVLIAYLTEFGSLNAGNLELGWVSVIVLYVLLWFQLMRRKRAVRR